MTQNASLVLGTWKLRSYEREELATGRRHDQFGEQPDGYLGYAPDGRMYAIFTRHDRIMPADVVPTEEEGVQLLGGHGFVKEHPVERWYRDLRAAGVMEGALLV